MTKLKKNLVVVPCYNEAKNIEPIIREIYQSSPEAHIMIVDDNSADGTAAIVKNLQKESPQLHLIERAGKLGLGTAYLTAFRWALENGYDKVVEMDADFSHNPKVLPNIFSNLDTYPAVVGSRYTKGGGTENWNWLRKLISRGGSWYARTILSMKVRDLTGGFNGWRSEVLRTINLDAIKSEGYAFQIELKYRSYQAGFQIKEIPITFSERREGQSKMSLWIVLEALLRVWKFRFAS